VTRTQTLIFPFQPSFFGLTDKYTESVYEQFFVLKYHGGWSLIEAYSLPIQLREWFVKRLAKQLTDEKEHMDSEMAKANHKR
jgi:hypothetical protein